MKKAKKQWSETTRLIAIVAAAVSVMFLIVLVRNEYSMHKQIISAMTLQ